MAPSYGPPILSTEVEILEFMERCNCRLSHRLGKVLRNEFGYLQFAMHSFLQLSWAC
jgi:hypothetical protein